MHLDAERGADGRRPPAQLRVQRRGDGAEDGRPDVEHGRALSLRHGLHGPGHEHRPRPQRHPVRSAARRARTAATAPDAITVDNEGGRNGARGPSFFQIDMRLGYRLKLGGAAARPVRRVFNLTNRANFANPTGDRFSTNFLVLTALRPAPSRARRSSAPASRSNRKRPLTPPQRAKSARRGPRLG